VAGDASAAAAIPGAKTAITWAASGSDAPTLFYALPELHYPGNLNVVQVIRDTVEEHGWHGRRIFIEGGVPVDYSEVLNRAGRYAQALVRLGVGPGDRVLLRLPDSVDLVSALLAVFQLRAVAIPTFMQLRAEEVAFRIHDADVSVVVTDAAELQLVEQALGDDGHVKVLTSSRDHRGLCACVDDLVGPDEAQQSVIPTHSDDVALILYTSGTTGPPKGACHTHRDLLAVCDSYARYSLRLSPDDVIAGPPPIPFALGFGLFVLFPLRFGCTAVVGLDKQPKALIRACGDFHVTVLAAVPTYYSLLLREEAVRNGGLKRVQRFMCGGEPLPDGVADDWIGVTAQPLTQFLGTTEMLHIFIAPMPDCPPPRGALGRPVPGYNVVLRDPQTFQPVDRGQEGILTVTGPTGTKYWKRPDKQGEAVRDGWNVIPDVLREENDGYLYFVARADDMIMSGGMRISPAQVESALSRHPSVVESACVAAPDPHGVRPSVIKAYVVLAEGIRGGDELARELQDFVKANAAPYLYPRLVEFVQALPRTASGKLMRRALQERARESGEGA
jgi:2-aminobenzoate-CoA ligase